MSEPYTSPNVRKMIVKLEHLHDEPSVLLSMCRRLDITDASFFHAVVMISVGLYIILTEASTLNVFEWRDTYFKSPTTDSYRYLFWFSIGYFVYDTIFIGRKIYRQGWRITVEDFGYLFHHAVCVYGLAYPTIYAKDGPIILCGFLMGEFSNPPRFFAEHLGYEMDEIRQIVQKSRGVKLDEQKVKRYFSHIAPVRRLGAFLHFYLFIFFRAALVYYAIAIMMPLCELPSSVIAAVLMLLFSVATVFFVYAERAALPHDYYDAEAVFTNTRKQS